jgi:hypothetical protein
MEIIEQQMSRSIIPSLTKLANRLDEQCISAPLHPALYSDDIIERIAKHIFAETDQSTMLTCSTVEKWIVAFQSEWILELGQANANVIMERVRYTVAVRMYESLLSFNYAYNRLFDTTSTDMQAKQLSRIQFRALCEYKNQNQKQQAAYQKLLDLIFGVTDFYGELPQQARDAFNTLEDMRTALKASFVLMPMWLSTNHPKLVEIMQYFRMAVDADELWIEVQYSEVYSDLFTRVIELAINSYDSIDEEELNEMINDYNILQQYPGY